MISYDTILFKASRDACNKDLRVNYIYQYNPTGSEYPTARAKRNSVGFIIDPSFSISISEGFEKNRMFIPGNRYFAFISLFRKAVDLVSENLFKIFPNVSKTEFESDSRVLERFQNEKALAVCGMTAMPTVYTDDQDCCYPGIKFTSLNGMVNIALEDALQLKEVFEHFDPICYSATMLHFFTTGMNQ